MSWPATFDAGRVDLFTEGRVDREDADRQLAAAKEILRRLDRQPGVVLADEVGMGKTFVALAVATAAAWSDKGGRPVVIMVPPSLRDKWPRDYEVFRNLCLRSEQDRALRVEAAHSALDLFRLLDDPRSRRARIIFLTHGAFHVSLVDPWVKLAIVKRALHGIHVGERRQALPRFLADLIRTKSTFQAPELFERLLAAGFDRWRDLVNEYAPDDERLTDDPIPTALQKVLARGDFDLEPLKENLRQLPARASANIDARLKDARRTLNQAIREIWPQALSQASFRSPLLILDEAHHLKNPATKLASLFVEPEAHEDGDLVAGALDGAFERMLFLTATPFQLGHHELLSVLTRFQGIDWKTLPAMTPDQFGSARAHLRASLDEAQVATTDLDWKWRLVTWEDISGSGTPTAVSEWWATVRTAETLPERLQVVRRAYLRAHEHMKKAEAQLRPWVVRHLRRRTLPGTQTARRVRLVGSGIHSDNADEVSGLHIRDEAVLPFLLAARSQALVARAGRVTGRTSLHRATFAEGLASSYEAFLETRSQAGSDCADIGDEAPQTATPQDDRLARYLGRLAKTLPSPEAYARHPKMAALSDKVLDLWSRGEKAVVFCHFRATGRAIARHLSAAIDRRLWANTSQRLGVDEQSARERVRLAGEAFDDGRPLQRVLRSFLDQILDEAPAITPSDRERVQDIVRRFVRTPLFVGRYLDLGAGEREDALRTALTTADSSGATLHGKIRDFVLFITTRCQPGEREEYLEALESIHPGLRGEHPTDAADISDAGGVLLPNVRLANGSIRSETRRRLLLGFNTPFFPEVLVASSVMAEGVDLHLNCRHLIHYDLSWNPSTVEQRTGRVDRIGAKAERTGQSIQVYMPYVAGTQDEKMFRVVTDRERWFQVVMGEEYRTDEAATDRLADRVPLPEEAAVELAFRLEVSR